MRITMTFAVAGLAFVAGLVAPAQAVELTEAELCKLVAGGSQVSLVYTQDPADAQVRVFEIYGVGRTSADNLAVFGRQVSGHSPLSGGGTAKLPDWRTFRVDRLKSLEDSGTTFTAEKPAAGDFRLISKWSCTNPAMEVK